MSLKSLSAIAKLSVVTVAIAINVGIPSIAETVKDIQVESQFTRINNKEHRNKQTNPSLIGSWKAVVSEKGQVANIFDTLMAEAHESVKGQNCPARHIG